MGSDLVGKLVLLQNNARKNAGAEVFPREEKCRCGGGVCGDLIAAMFPHRECPGSMPRPTAASPR